MNTFKVCILAADHQFFEGECEALVIPTHEGQYGVLAHHCNMISSVVPGMLKYTLSGGEVRLAAVSEGLIKVENNDVLILVDSAERPEDIDANRAKRAADEAKEIILQRRSLNEHRTAEADLARAISRIRVRDMYMVKKN